MDTLYSGHLRLPGIIPICFSWKNLYIPDTVIADTFSRQFGRLYRPIADTWKIKFSISHEINPKPYGIIRQAILISTKIRITNHISILKSCEHFTCFKNTILVKYNDFDKFDEWYTAQEYILARNVLKQREEIQNGGYVIGLIIPRQLMMKVNYLKYVRS